MAEKARLQQQFDPRHHEANYLQPASPSSSRANTVTVSVAGESQGDASSSVPDRGPTPPPYSGPAGPAPERDPDPPSRGPPRYPGLPAIDYRLYSPALFELSADSVSIRSSAPHWSSNTAALVDLIRAQSTVPPKPQIHISGKRNTKLDFSVKLNLMSLLVPEDQRRRMDYIRCVADGELALRGGVKASTEPSVGDGGLEEWAKWFVADAGSVKSFVLERVVANLDTGWLEGQIRSMVAATGYKGNVTVSFPVTHAKVVVQSPDKVNKFFTSVTTLFAGKVRYEVVKAVWPFATARAGEPERQFAVQSEEKWWREWKDPIKYAIATKRQGWVTNEDKLEAIMEGRAKQVGIIDWGPDYDY
ncbi:hypothetical protein QBC39DRAFT_268496 [Podospora conica]|nr:hypothetical protein QBC39DRAFT_268496 [Schizothecium conicum]